MARITESLELSHAENRVLSAILDYQTEHGRAPTLKTLLDMEVFWRYGEEKPFVERGFIEIIRDDSPAFVIVADLGKLALSEHHEENST